MTARRGSAAEPDDRRTGLVPSYDEDSQRLIISVTYVGDDVDGEQAKNGIWRELMRAFQYLADGIDESSYEIPDSAPEVIRAGIELYVTDDLFTDEIVTMLEDLNAFCVSRDLQFAVRPVARDLMVGTSTA